MSSTPSWRRKDTLLNELPISIQTHTCTLAKPSAGMCVQEIIRCTGCRGQFLLFRNGHCFCTSPSSIYSYTTVLGPCCGGAELPEPGQPSLRSIGESEAGQWPNDRHTTARMPRIFDFMSGAAAKSESSKGKQENRKKRSSEPESAVQRDYVKIYGPAEKAELSLEKADDEKQTLSETELSAHSSNIKICRPAGKSEGSTSNINEQTQA